MWPLRGQSLRGALQVNASVMRAEMKWQAQVVSGGCMCSADTEAPPVAQAGVPCPDCGSNPELPGQPRKPRFDSGHVVASILFGPSYLSLALMPFFLDERNSRSQLWQLVGFFALASAEAAIAGTIVVMASPTLRARRVVVVAMAGSIPYQAACTRLSLPCSLGPPGDDANAWAA